MKTHAGPKASNRKILNSWQELMLATGWGSNKVRQNPAAALEAAQALPRYRVSHALAQDLKDAQYRIDMGNAQ